MLVVRVPPLYKSFDRGHVDAAVVGECVELWHVLFEEQTVHINGIAGNWAFPWKGNVFHTWNIGNDVPGSVCSFKNSITSFSAWVIVYWLSIILSISPFSRNVFLGHGSMLSSTSFGWWITISGPCAIVFSSESVTMTAISQSVWS